MASAEAEQKAEATVSGSGGGGGGGGKLVLILSIVNILATLGMMGILFVSFQREKSRPAVEDIAAHGGDAGGHGEKAEGAKSDGHGGGSGGHGESKEGAKKKSDIIKMVTLEQFTINLATPGSSVPKFVRVNVSLSVPNEDSEAEVNAKMPQIRNAIIDLFNSKKPADLATVDGRDYLKEEIKNALNSFLVTGKVEGIFFTNFALSS